MTIYIIKIILCSALFIFIYKVMLEKEKMHRFNRLYLLASLALSFIIPCITFNAAAPTSSILQNVIPNNGNLFELVNNKQSIEVSGTNYLVAIFLTVYMSVTIILFFRFAINLKSIFSKIKGNSIIAFDDAKLVLIYEKLTPHSFLNYIFIHKDEYQNGNIENEILLHELTHVKQKHSFDILFIEIIQVFCWFNPVLSFYRKAMQLNHEFLADEIVINTYHNTTAYQYLLIDKAGKPCSSVLTSQFNYSIIKKRLKMMTKTKSFKTILCKQIAVIPVFAISLLMFSTKIIAQQISSTLKQTQKETPSTRKGVSLDMLNEYDQIINKTKNEKGSYVFSEFSEKDKSRLETIFLSMSKDQQSKQVVVFMPAPPPLPKVVPTKEQLESWKESKIFGLWINGKRESNSVLNNYMPADFAHVFVSKLSKNAINYGKHFYQVNLMTTEYYRIYYEQAIALNAKYYLGVRRKNNQAKFQ